MAQLPDSIVEGLVWVANERKLCKVTASVSSALIADLEGNDHATQGVEHLSIYEMGAMEVAVCTKTLDQRRCRIERDERLQHRGAVNDQHRSAVASRADGG